MVNSLEKKIDETERKYEETNKICEERLKQALEAESKIIELKTNMQRFLLRVFYLHQLVSSVNYYGAGSIGYFFYWLGSSYYALNCDLWLKDYFNFNDCLTLFSDLKKDFLTWKLRTKCCVNKHY